MPSKIGGMRADWGTDFLGQNFGAMPRQTIRRKADVERALRHFEGRAYE